MKDLAIILGIRPDVIRASKIIKLLSENNNITFDFIWSGQHYSENMKDVFFKQLNVPEPDVCKFLVLLVASPSASVFTDGEPEVFTSNEVPVGIGSRTYASLSHVAFLTTFNAFNCESKLLSYLVGQSKVII